MQLHRPSGSPLFPRGSIQPTTLPSASRPVPPISLTLVLGSSGLESNWKVVRLPPMLERIALYRRCDNFCAFMGRWCSEIPPISIEYIWCTASRLLVASFKVVPFVQNPCVLVKLIRIEESVEVGGKW